MFDSVKEIVFNLGRRRTRYVNVFNPSTKKINESSERNLELYEAIKLNKVTSNKEAAKFLGYENQEDKAYLMAMGRFRNSLLNLFFFLDEKHNFSNDYLRAQAKAIRFAMFGRLMFLVGLPLIGLKQLQKAILLCKQHQITDILEDTMLRYLMMGVRFGRGSYLSKYLNEYPEIKKQSEALKNAEYQACIIFNIGSGRKRINKDSVVHLEAAINELNQIDNVWKDIRLEELKFISNAFYLQYKSNIVELHKVCEEYENNLLENKFTRNKHFTELYRVKLIALFYSASFEECKACFEIGVQRFNKNISNYLNFLEIYFLACMRHQNYKQAEEIREEVSTHKLFKLLHSSHKERWMIYEPFLFFALKSIHGLDYEVQTENESHAVKIARFLKKTPIAAKDKMGLNAQILISQILLLLLDRTEENENAIIDRANALKTYNHRYFKSPGNFSLQRTYYFIQFLIIVAESAFDLDDVLKKSKKVLNKLNKNSNEYIDITENFETIPYDHLIELILEHLKK